DAARAARSPRPAAAPRCARGRALRSPPWSVPPTGAPVCRSSSAIPPTICPAYGINRCLAHQRKDRSMIALFTDFGLEGPYIGQMKAVLHRLAPNVPVIDLFADLPPFDAEAAAYLLAAYAPEMPT